MVSVITEERPMADIAPQRSALSIIPKPGKPLGEISKPFLSQFTPKLWYFIDQY
jgi:hypothetical protein